MICVSFQNYVLNLKSYYISSNIPQGRSVTSLFGVLIRVGRGCFLRAMIHKNLKRLKIKCFNKLFYCESVEESR